MRARESEQRGRQKDRIEVEDQQVRGKATLISFRNLGLDGMID